MTRDEAITRALPEVKQALEDFPDHAYDCPAFEFDGRAEVDACKCVLVRLWWVEGILKAAEGVTP